MSYTAGLAWKRSDGDPSSWPTKEEQQRPTEWSNWQEQLEPTHEKYKLYETKVGEKLAELSGVKAASYRIKMPAGYALFAHHKPNKETGVERVDVYLRGCTSIGRKYFRSTNEFLPHAEWLQDTSKPLTDHSTCECIYNSSSSAAQAKKAGSSSLANGNVNTPKRTPNEKKRKDPPQTEDDLAPAIVPERLIDMTSGRRTRKGELVWFHIDTPIEPPAGASAGSPSITHWPGLVAGIEKKAVVDPSSSKSAESSTIASAIASTSDAPPPPAKKFVETWVYKIRPLGFFSLSAELSKRPEELLPYAAGSDLLGGTRGWDVIGQEGTRVIKERAAAEIAEYKGKGMALPTAADVEEMDKRWRERLAKKYAFKEMPKEWDTVIFRLGLAIKVASSICNAWTHTDKIDLVPGTGVSEEDAQAIREQRKSLYQGVWWGGERIWVDDMVRLKKHRAELDVESLGSPSNGAADRAVVLKIRLINLEVSPDSTPEKTVWRSILYGDLYEVADGPANGSETQPLGMGADDWAALACRPPEGYHYKRLNPEGTDVTTDIMDVAGRAYPDLLDLRTQISLQHPSRPPEDASRLPAGDSSVALTGLRPGTLVASRSERWKDDLYGIVTDATKSVEREMKKYYLNLLNSTPASGSSSSKGKAPETADNVVPPVTAQGGGDVEM